MLAYGEIMYYIRQTLLSYECVHHTEGLGTTDLEQGYKAFTLWLEQSHKTS